jgi:mycothiol S-conjugate amidase
VTTTIACADHFETRDRALMAHATQVDPDGFWFQVPLEIQQRVWGVEEFEAAVSYVPVAEGEDDLFAGLGSPTEADALATREGLEIAYDGRVSGERAPEEAPRIHGREGGDSSDTHVDEDETTEKADA